MRIETVEVYHLSQPLSEPYHLSYRSIEALDSVWVKVELEGGGTGWGESTPLPGYSESDLDGVWKATNTLSESWAGKDAEALFRAPIQKQDGFLYTAFWSALEEAAGKIPALSGMVPLVGLVQERENESPEQALQRIREQGYKVFKIKAGFLPEEADAKRLRLLQRELQGGERIRIDANQALTEAQAAMLLRTCEPGKVELFEQPLPVGAWDACARLAKHAPVPIMLDESITDMDSLHHAAKSGAAQLVKLKWMKQGGMMYLSKMTECARELGLKVVLGNGVAGWLNNRHEAIFWLDRLQDMKLAGEMNGYLKLLHGSGLLGFSRGALLLSKGREVIDMKQMNVLALRTYGA